MSVNHKSIYCLFMQTLLRKLKSQLRRVLPRTLLILVSILLHQGLLYAFFVALFGNRIKCLAFLEVQKGIAPFLPPQVLWVLLCDAVSLRRLVVARILLNSLSSSKKPKDLKFNAGVLSVEHVLLEAEHAMNENPVDTSMPSIDLCSFSTESLFSLHDYYFKLNYIGSPQHCQVLQAIQAREYANSSFSDGKYEAVLLSYEWFMAIGHFYYLDGFLKGIALGIIPIRYVIFPELNDDQIFNKLALRRYMQIAHELGILLVDTHPMVKLPIQNIFCWPIDKVSFAMSDKFSFQIQDLWFKSGRSPFQLLNSLELDSCTSLLQQDVGRMFDQFITLQVRQPGYMNDAGTPIAFRNSNPLPFYSAVSSALQSNEICIVLGDPSDPAVPSHFSDCLFDYPHSSLKSEIFDLYLVCYSRLHIGTTSGLSHLPNIFRATTLLLDAYVFHPFYGTIRVPRIVRKKGVPITYDYYLRKYPWIDYPFNEVMHSLCLQFPHLDGDVIYKSIHSFVSAARACAWSRQLLLGLNSVPVVFPSLYSDPVTCAIEKSFYDLHRELFPNLEEVQIAEMQYPL